MHTEGCNNTWRAFRVSSSEREWGQTRTVKGIRLSVFSSHPVWYCTHQHGHISLFKTNDQLILCPYLNGSYRPHSFSVFMNNMSSAAEYILLIWTLMRTRLLSLLSSSSQMLTTASPSHVKMEALASTRLIHSSACACPATEETRVRKVRVRILQQQIQFLCHMILAVKGLLQSVLVEIILISVQRLYV